MGRAAGQFSVGLLLLMAALAGTPPVAYASTITGVSIVAPATPTAVPQYAKVELTVALTGLPTGMNPYEANPAAATNGMDMGATFTSPTNVAWHVHGFYDGTTWRIRFTPGEVGAWSYSVATADASGTATWTGGTFTVIASASRGFAQIKGKYLCYQDGGALFPIGHNMGWQANVERPAFTDMAAQGENMLSFWFATPWATMADMPTRCAIENMQSGVGSYNQQACGYIDGVLSRAEAAGVYVLPSIWAHDQLRDANHPWGAGSWGNNPYSTFCTPADFFKTTDAGADTRQWRLQKNFLRYVIARWGYSPSVLGFVGVVELNGTTGFGGTAPYANPAQAEAWCGSVRTYVAGLDPFRTNAAGQTLLTFSKTDGAGTSSAIMDATTWANGGDLRGMDSYVQQGNDIGVASLIAFETRAMRSLGPAVITEFGGDKTRGATQPAHLHSGIWAGMSAGAAMMPIEWCDGINFVLLTNGMRAHIQYLSQFMSKIDYLGNGALAEATLTTSLNAWGMSLSDRGFFWVQNATGPVGGQTVSVGNVTPGTYRVYWYDVWTSGSVPILAQPVASTGTTLTVTVPPLLQQDIACRFEINVAPVAQGASLLTKRDTPLAIALSAADGNGDTLTYAIVTPPSQGALSGIAPNLTYTPNPAFAGTDTFTFTASDGVATSNTATVTIVVNDPPVAANQAVATLEDTPVGITLAATDPEATDTLTYTVLSQPSHGTLSGTAPNLTYLSSQDYNGSDSFTFKVNDGYWDSGVATVSITIVPVNDPPVAYPQSALTSQDKAVTITLFATDVENEPLSYSVVTTPSHGTLSGTGANLTYTPAPGYSGADSFTYKANDGELDGNVETVSVSVNAAPRVESLAVPANANAGHVLPFAASASDAENDPLTYSWNFGDGTVGAGASVTHTYAVLGTYLVTVTVADIHGNTAVASATANIATYDGGTLTDNDGDGIPNTVDPDNDNDGYRNEVETILGSDPMNSSSRPLDMPMAVATAGLSVAKMGVKLNFAKPKRCDSVQVSGTLPIPAGFVLKDQKAIVDVGGVVRLFTLDAKGSSTPKTNDTFKLGVRASKGAVAAQTAKFQLKLSQGTLAYAFADEGLTDRDVTTHVTISVEVIVNGRAYESAVPQTYKARAGKTGATRK